MSFISTRQTFHCFHMMLQLLVLLALAPQVTAEPQVTESNGDWYYTFRPTDSMQSISKRFLNTNHDWPELVRYNRIDDVNSLQAGSIIRIPIAWLKFQPQPAKVLSVDGNVLIKKDRFSQYQLLKANTLIQVGFEIMSRNGTALIKLADNSIVRVESDTQLSFNRMSHFGETGMVDTRLRLKKGGVISEVAPLEKGSRFEIRTPSAVAAVRGTEFRLRSDASGSQIEVTEGNVEFSHAHGSQTVGAGEGARVNVNSAIITSKKLYEAPARSFSAKSVGELPFKLSWEPSAGAKSYKYELRVDSPAGNVLQSKQLSSPEVELEHVSNGDYQVAMRAIDKDGFEGMDDVASVSVELDGDTPSLLLPIQSSIVNSSELEFGWSLKRPETKSKLQVSTDRDFVDFVYEGQFQSETKLAMNNQLDPGVYYWRVIGLSADHVESASDSRKLSVRGLMNETRILSVNYVGNQVGLFWNSIDEANGYILQISDSKNFLRILREETIQKPSAFLKLTPGKNYYARIKGIPNELFESEFGPSETLFIPEDAAP
ncbi:MAG: hypothetical protein C9356_18325 [Oleiphilus sp.]|nr:MAG: hypothetical protein C9356_18325 [Oleiphilus sp.]